MRFALKLSDSVNIGKNDAIHFVGIGGAGMCALAEILHHRGCRLTGSDNNESDTLARIRRLGIPVTMGHRAENVEGAALVVHTAAVHDDNAELVAARAKGIPVIDRAQLLGLVTDEYANTIAVSGTHGKTTTTSMLTQIFVEANLDPTALIGGKLPFIGGNSRVGKSQTMVCEACEFVDSFLRLHPAVAVILNIDDDHLDYFKTVDNLIQHFNLFTQQTARAVIYNGDDANTLRAVAGSTLKKVTFGFGEKNDFSPINLHINEDGHFVFGIVHDGETVANITLHVPGSHNVYNALAACAAAWESGASFADIERGLNDYTGAGRRFEILGQADGVTIADDYAHHPTELAATLRAAKQLHYRKVWAVFQPFTYSRTKMLMDDFAAALKIADYVVLSEIMGSREVNTYNVYASDLAAKVPGSVWFPTFGEIADYVTEHAQPGDLVITLGCGDIYKAAKLMLKANEKQAV